MYLLISKLIKISGIEVKQNSHMMREILKKHQWFECLRLRQSYLFNQTVGSSQIYYCLQAWLEERHELYWHAKFISTLELFQNSLRFPNQLTIF